VSVTRRRLPEIGALHSFNPGGYLEALLNLLLTIAFFLRGDAMPWDDRPAVTGDCSVSPGLNGLISLASQIDDRKALPDI